MKKIISVIMVAYNADKTLRAALDSLIAQDIDRDRFEVVFIDDGSTDTTKEIVANYLTNNSLPLSYHYQQNA
jgi:glycosyltransferase involved in cell wall biosynthesis